MIQCALRPPNHFICLNERPSGIFVKRAVVNTSLACLGQRALEGLKSVGYIPCVDLAEATGDRHQPICPGIVTPPAIPFTSSTMRARFLDQTQLKRKLNKCPFSNCAR